MMELQNLARIPQLVWPHAAQELCFIGVCSLKPVGHHGLRYTSTLMDSVRKQVGSARWSQGGVPALEKVDRSGSQRVGPEGQ